MSCVKQCYTSLCVFVHLQLHLLAASSCYCWSTAKTSPVRARTSSAATAPPASQRKRTAPTSCTQSSTTTSACQQVAYERGELLHRALLSDAVNQALYSCCMIRCLYSHVSDRSYMGAANKRFWTKIYCRFRYAVFSYYNYLHMLPWRPRAKGHVCLCSWKMFDVCARRWRWSDNAAHRDENSPHATLASNFLA